MSNTTTLSREQALELLQTHSPEKHLVQHALASEAVLRALAQHINNDAQNTVYDEDMWALTGLLHDLDYASTAATPEKHGLVGSDMLSGLLCDEGRAAIRAHNGEMNGSTPTTPLDFALRCGESVTGLVVTAALVRPTGITGMQAKSLKKKMKDKAFAASVSRENIRQCEKIGLDLDAFLHLAIESMSAKATELQLPTGA